MAKVKIISSYSLECLRSRTNNDIDEAHRMIEQLDGEAQRSSNPETRQNVLDRKIPWEARIECYRAALNNIAIYTSEIEI